MHNNMTRASWYNLFHFIAHSRIFFKRASLFWHRSTKLTTITGIALVAMSTPGTHWDALSRDHPACVIVDVTGPPTSPRVASPPPVTGDTRTLVPLLRARKIRFERAEGEEKSRPWGRTALSAPTLAWTPEQRTDPTPEPCLRSSGAKGNFPSSLF